MKLIVGLGNPGELYQWTRHNMGFLCVETIARQYHFSEWKHDKNFFGSLCFGEINQQKVILLKPETYMNLSGKSVQAVRQFYKLLFEDIIIIHDDIDLDFAIVRSRKNGGSGGHNGLKSIFNMLQSQDIARIKLGIKNEKKEFMDTADFVLARFFEVEREALPSIFSKAIQELLKILP